MRSAGAQTSVAPVGLAVSSNAVGVESRPSGAAEPDGGGASDAVDDEGTAPPFGAEARLLHASAKAATTPAMTNGAA